ncbi:MAG TPA: enolase C-terminal domain-like protein [archaeon]|nr:enolase C-terminal domain-like protein [archaeon]
MLINSISIKPIKNLLGGETIEAEINNRYTASSPIGTSKSSYEAKALPANKAIKNFQKIKKQFTGSFSQNSFDELLKKKMHLLGSTATTALSLAFFKPSKPLNIFPHLLGNVAGGGAHGGFGYIQEILTTPKAKTIGEAIAINTKIWKDIGKHAKKTTSESAWIVGDDLKALQIVRKIADNYSAKMGIDFAASQIYKNGFYCYGKKKIIKEKQMDYIAELRNRFDLYYIEDPLNETDFSGFAQLKKSLKKTLICGDDLIATNKKRFSVAAKRKSINAVIIKPNQAGNVTDCLEIIKMAKKRKIVPVVSHRSGETKDATISLLALHAPLAKLGVAGNRIYKLNELKRLWREAKKPGMSKLRIK